MRGRARRPAASACEIGFDFPEVFLLESPSVFFPTSSEAAEAVSWRVVRPTTDRRRFSRQGRNSRGLRGKEPSPAIEPEFSVLGVLSWHAYAK
ncbi:putative 50S ribosomal protein L28 [Burkholderia pseudomallei MSHR7343]|nr:putative 50S ribosomal protein L28 [Burkholderia pseudomallei MSHR7343]